MRKRFILVALTVVNLIAWQGCEYETIPGPVNCDENPVVLEIVSVGDSNCELVDGRIEVMASGGDDNYQYLLGDEQAQESPVFEGLPAGVYTITAIDGNTCSAATVEATVKNLNGLNIRFATTEAGCTGTDGSITINATDGTEPYQYKIGDGVFTTNNTFTGLARGNYGLVVKDASGCSVSQAVRVRAGISFSESIAPIIETNCAINDCHNGSQFPDFRQFKNVHDNAAQVKALTADRTMPEEGTLTQAQINMIACWVDDGALNN
jgi:hypothetical protein